MRIEMGEVGKKVELLPPRRVIPNVDAGETSNRGRWQSQSKHVMSNF